MDNRPRRRARGMDQAYEPTPTTGEPPSGLNVTSAVLSVYPVKKRRMGCAARGLKTREMKGGSAMSRRVHDGRGEGEGIRAEMAERWHHSGDNPENCSRNCSHVQIRLFNNPATARLCACSLASALYRHKPGEPRPWPSRNRNSTPPSEYPATD